MPRPTVFLLACALALLLPGRVPAQDSTGSPPAPSDPVGVELARLIVQGEHPTMRWRRFPDARADMARFYGARGWRTRWLEAGVLNPGGATLLARFAAAESLGLEPEDYDAGRLARTAASYASGRRPDAAETARFDLALSIDAWRFVSALRYGRVSPQAAHGTLELPRELYDLAAAVDSLADPARAGGVLMRAQPPFRHYRLLLDALAFYRRIALDSSLVLPPPTDETLKPGATYVGAARLRTLLTALGDLPDSLQPAPPPGPAADTTYAPELVEAVRNFQRRQNLKADGAIGRQTRARIEQPFPGRLLQIRLALERWRWLPHAFRSPPIFVNLPAFRLEAFRTPDDDEAQMMAMDVVVGTAYSHDTPVFTANLRYLVFRPYWEVPTSIMRAEIRPAARRDSSYLAREQFDLMRGDELVPVTRENIDAIGGAVRVRQRPGPANALGSVKFMLPNPYNIYLHDTPAKGRFAVVRRDFSHGCIRLSQPESLAVFVLRDQPTWTPALIESAKAGAEPKQVYLKRPIPTYLIYATAVARQDGRTYFYDDLYGHDATLDGLLQRGYPYPE
ncbi:MAG: L,D-transpeptidase family protein [Candidatus Eisenbacteria bacterium]